MLLCCEWLQGLPRDLRRTAQTLYWPKVSASRASKFTWLLTKPSNTEVVSRCSACYQ